jgi:hypothetical protein
LPGLLLTIQRAGNIVPAHQYTHAVWTNLAARLFPSTPDLENHMNAAGLKVTIAHVASIINSSIYFDKLTSEGVSAAELKGTRQDATALAKALATTPSEKIEALVTRFNGQLTHALNNFMGDWQMNQLKGFRDAQIMIGFVTSLCNKAGIRT